MHRLERSALILPLLLAACQSYAPVPALTDTTQLTPTAFPSDTPVPMPTATATRVPLPTLAPGEDACSQVQMAVYLRGFAITMTQYELSLAQVYGLTMGHVAPEALTAEINQVQAERDSAANMETPYCAQKMQASLLSSMDHILAGLRLVASGADAKKARTEFSQASLDYNAVKAEFGDLGAKAGVEASPTATP